MGRERVFRYGDIGSRFFCGFVAPAGGGFFLRHLQRVAPAGGGLFSPATTKGWLVASLWGGVSGAHHEGLTRGISVVGFSVVL